ncbi:hypothetical protein EI613_00360 [Azospirillum sp. 412522]|nr:hypothetical protein [Azospirillum sp. 412522]
MAAETYLPLPPREREGAQAELGKGEGHARIRGSMSGQPLTLPTSWVPSLSRGGRGQASRIRTAA